MHNIILLAMITVLAWIFIQGARSVIRDSQKKQSRSKSLARVARRRHWRFVAHERSLDHRELPFGLFAQGRTQSLRNVIRGSAKSRPQHLKFVAGDCCIEDLIQTPRGGTIPQERSFSFVVFLLPYRGLPRMVIRRERMWDKVLAVFGLPDIQFNAEDFDPVYHVSSEDVNFARRFVQVDMMTLLVNRGRMPMILQDNRCCATDGSSLWTEETFREAIEFMGEFFERWPHEILRAEFRRT